MVEIIREPVTPLDRALTVNFWAHSENTQPHARMAVLLDTLDREGFRNREGVGIIMAFQEVVIDGDNQIFDPLEMVREGLGYTEDHVHFFPLREGGKTGTGIITNCPMMQRYQDTIQPRLDIGQDRRNVGILDLKHRDGITTAAVTHLSYDEQQNAEVIQCIEAIKRHLSANRMLNADDQETIAKLIRSGKLPQTSFLFLADTNAAPNTRVHQRLLQEGLIDFTEGLRTFYSEGYTWPVNVDWLNAMHNHTLEFDLLKAQRWMDYILGVGLTPVGAKIIGTRPVYVNVGETHPLKLYESGSDHALVGVYFR
jgi:hypothetical protein